MIIHDLGPSAVAGMTQVDLAELGREPDSPIEHFSFHSCVCGVAAFSGRPPWERHTAGDELLLVLAGESLLTVVESGFKFSETISAGTLVIVPEGRWHNNDSTDGVTFLYMTPADGNEHSWDDPG